MVKLPAPRKKGDTSIEETLAKRRSKRKFTSKELSWEQVSQLLWSVQGMLEKGLRTAPSAGATYPLEVYLVTSQCVYHYQPRSHELMTVLEGDVRPQLCRASLNQDWITEAPISIVIAAKYDRTGTVYGSRATRYVHMEVGHAAQNVHLQAVALGLGSVPVGAFRDEEVHKVLSLPKDHQPLYIIPVGYPAE